MIKGKFCIKTLIAGGYFGELEVLSNISRTFAVKAQTHCQLLRIPGGHFLEVLNQYPSVKLDVLKRAICSQIKISQAIKTMANFSKLHLMDNFWKDHENTEFDSGQRDKYHAVVEAWFSSYMRKNKVGSMDLE